MIKTIIPYLFSIVGAVCSPQPSSTLQLGVPRCRPAGTLRTVSNKLDSPENNRRHTHTQFSAKYPICWRNHTFVWFLTVLSSQFMVNSVIMCEVGQPRLPVCEAFYLFSALHRLLLHADSLFEGTRKHFRSRFFSLNDLVAMQVVTCGD